MTPEYEFHYAIRTAIKCMDIVIAEGRSNYRDEDSLEVIHVIEEDRKILQDHENDYWLKKSE